MHFLDQKKYEKIQAFADIVTTIMIRYLHHLVVLIVTGILSGTKHGHDGPTCGHYQDDSCLVLNKMMVRNFAGIEVSRRQPHIHGLQLLF